MLFINTFINFVKRFLRRKRTKDGVKVLKNRVKTLRDKIRALRKVKTLLLLILNFFAYF